MGKVNEKVQNKNSKAVANEKQNVQNNKGVSFSPPAVYNAFSDKIFKTDKKEWMGEQWKESLKGISTFEHEREFFNKSASTEVFKKESKGENHDAHVSILGASSEGKGGANFKMDDSGIEAGLNAEGSAEVHLLEARALGKGSLPVKIGGEDLGIDAEIWASVFVGAEVKGSVEASFKAQIEETAKKTKANGNEFPKVDTHSIFNVQEEVLRKANPKFKGKKIDKKGSGKLEGDVSAEVEAFVGVKGEAGASLKVNWNKKDFGFYQNRIISRLKEILKLTNNPLAYVPISDDIYTKAILLVWDDSKKDGLIGVTGILSGRAGAGAKGKVEVGVKNGKFRFDVSGALTIGLGGGASVALDVDVIDIPLFLLAIDYGKMGEDLKKVEEKANDLKQKAFKKIFEKIKELTDFEKDNRAMASVNNGEYKKADPAARAQMIKDMNRGFKGVSVKNWEWMGGENEAIDKIIAFSIQNGDIEVVKQSLPDKEKKRVDEFISARNAARFAGGGSGGGGRGSW